jgi:PAS domain S-box-containing protein
VADQLMSRATRSEEAIVAGNRAGVIEWVNPTWTRLTGCAVDDTVHKPIYRLLQEWEIDRSVLDFVQLNFLAGRRSVVEFPVTNLDGRSAWIHLEVEAGRDESGDVTDFVAFVSDITDRREAELALERHLDLKPKRDVRPAAGDGATGPEPQTATGHRLEALGLQAVEACQTIEPLAARVSQLCTGVDAPIGTEIAALAEAMRWEAQALLDRARRPERSTRPIDVSDVAHCCCMAISQSLPDPMLLDTLLPKGLPRASCNEAELASVLSDLLQLGVSSIGDAWGTLSISTGASVPGESLESDVYHARFAGTLYDEHQRLFIEIHDTGDALEGDELLRFGQETLPVPESGRLLTLMGARARTRAMGGELHVHAAPGCGTRVLLLLPVT